MGAFKLTLQEKVEREVIHISIKAGFVLVENTIAYTGLTLNFWGMLGNL